MGALDAEYRKRRQEFERIIGMFEHERDTYRAKFLGLREALRECVGELESAHNFMQAQGLYHDGIPRMTAIKVARALLEGGGAS
jgi:hypothetical protein